MILNVVKYSSAFITVLFGFHFLKTERERILLLLKEKDDKLLNCDKRINILEKELVNEKNKYNAIIRLLPNLEPESPPDTTPYNSLDEDVDSYHHILDTSHMVLYESLNLSFDEILFLEIMYYIMNIFFC